MRRKIYEAPHYAVKALVTSSLLFPKNTLSLCYILSVRDLVSHPYKTAGKIMILYVLIFELLERRGEEKTKDSELNGSKRFLNLTSS
jgi:hypothetical protein